jgi:hypothetical protein
METFKIIVEEMLSRTIEIDANNLQEAIAKVEQMYQNEEIVLDSDDYTDTKILAE